MGEAGFFALFVATAVIGGSLLLGPVGQAIARRLTGRRHERDGLTTGEMAAERVADLEARVTELETHQLRMLELEDRLDFAERLLASGPPRDAKVDVDHSSPAPS